MKSKILTVLFVVALTACSSTKSVTKPVTINDFVIVDPDPVAELNIKPPKWEVWNSSQMAANAAKSENADNVFYVLTQKEFSKLMDGLIDVSDRLQKFSTSNQYYKDSIDDYRKGKK